MYTSIQDQLNEVLANKVEPYLRQRLPQRFDKIESVDVTSWEMGNHELEGLVRQSQSLPEPVLMDPEEGYCTRTMLRLHIRNNNETSASPYPKLLGVTNVLSKNVIDEHLHTSGTEVMCGGILRVCIITIKDSFEDWE